jgi:DNA-binding transcriptional MerR regulator
MPEELLTIDEAAARLRTPVKTLRLWKRIGKGPQPRKLGTRLVYRASEIDAFVAELFDDQS